MYWNEYLEVLYIKKFWKHWTIVYNLKKQTFFLVKKGFYIELIKKLLTLKLLSLKKNHQTIKIYFYSAEFYLLKAIQKVYCEETI